MKAMRFLHHIGAASSRSVVEFLIVSLFLRRYILPVRSSKGWPFTERMAFAKGRRIVVLDNRYFGLFPAGTRQGDQVWVLDGGRVPYVLRQDCERGVWVLVEEASVHEIVRGEAFDGKKQRTILVS
jgi:hypothetical protein